MSIASGVRIGWIDLPEPVRAAVEGIIGSPVVGAVSQPGGFSPGTADRVVTVDGRRAFVKAVSPAQNQDSPKLYRREALITAALPVSAPVPAMLGSYDDGNWIVLVLQDVEGRHPATPWRSGELRQVLITLEDLARSLTPSPLPELPPATTRMANLFGGWHRLRAHRPADLDPWAASRLDQLCDQAERGLAALGGTTLAHTDLRADNLLIDEDGAVTVVDWPWACVGPAWLDTVLLLINVRLFGGHDTDALLADCASTFDADPAHLIAVLAGTCGYFLDAARQAPPPGLPTVRAFQQAQGDAVLEWLQELLP